MTRRVAPPPLLGGGRPVRFTAMEVPVLAHRHRLRLSLRVALFAAALVAAGCSSGGDLVARGFDSLFGFPAGTTKAIGGPPAPLPDEDAFTPKAQACGSCAASACNAASSACLNDTNCACTMPCRSGGGTPASCSAECGAPDATFATENGCLHEHCPDCGVAP